MRIVHSIDYYNATEYQQEDWMPNRCGVMHVRGPSDPKAAGQIVNVLEGININNYDPNSLRKAHMEEWLRLFESNVKSFVDYRERIDFEVAKRLGLKDPSEEIEKFIAANCQKIDKDVWLCPLSGKKFKGADYVRKHIESKHREKMLEVRKECEYFNRFVYDPKRPYLPEHPLTKHANMNPHHYNNYSSSSSYYGNSNYQDYQGGGAGGGGSGYYNRHNYSYNRFHGGGAYWDRPRYGGRGGGRGGGGGHYSSYYDNSPYRQHYRDRGYNHRAGSPHFSHKGSSRR